MASASAGSAKFGQKLMLTVNGSRLDQGLQVAAAGCTGVTLRTVAPNASTPTTAYYECDVSMVGAGQFSVKRTSDGATLATVDFAVPSPQVTLTVTNSAGVSGTIVIALAADKTPTTAANFLGYVNTGFYDGTAFHRVSPGFVIQGGGYAAPIDVVTPVAKATGAPITLEVGRGLSNIQWTVAMARTADANSATSQFFINLADNSANLDPSPVFGAGYAVFGTVSSGTATVSGIAGAPCTAIPFFLPSGDCTPSPNVVVTSAVQTQ